MRKGYVNPGMAVARSRTQFKPGITGRPPGARIKLGLLFVNALCEDFERHGVEALRRVREEEPSTYIRTIASIMPHARTANHQRWVHRRGARLPTL